MRFYDLGLIAMSSRHDIGWDRIYHRYRPESLPWELGKPRRVLVELVDSGRVAPGKALDLCCGAGTNPIYMAKKGFNVAALDISDKAVEYVKRQAFRANVSINFLVARASPLISGVFTMWK
jgi:2-polyprenyl-3-methyl-5-hydroxy-6-metoxy-1,4-benzoquinol methylase